MNQDTIERMRKRGQRYWFEDGLWELVIGSLLVVLAIYYGIVGSFEPGSALRTIFTVGYVVVVPGVMFLTSRVMRSLKAQVTAPRTGYVSFRRSKRRIARSVAIGATIAVATVAGTLLIEEINASVLISGLVIAFVFGATGYRVGPPRFYVPAVVSLTAAVLLSLTVDDSETAFSLLSGGVGLVVVASGGITFARYLRQNPGPDDLADERDEDADAANDRVDQA